MKYLNKFLNKDCVLFPSDTIPKHVKVLEITNEGFVMMFLESVKSENHKQGDIIFYPFSKTIIQLRSDLNE